MNVKDQTEHTALIEAAEATIKTPAIFQKVDYIINKSYLSVLEQKPIVPFADKSIIEASSCSCFFPIKKFVYDKEENNLQKLASVYSSLSGIDGNILMIVRGYADPEAETEIVLGISDKSANRLNGAYPKTRALCDSFLGNFPGCKEVENPILNCEETRILINNAFHSDYCTAASVSVIGSLRDKKKLEKNSEFYQGMEKVIEAMNGRDYTMLIIAQPIADLEIQSMRTELEDLYTKLSMFGKMTLAVNYSEAASISDSISHTLSDSVTKSESKTLSVGNNASISANVSVSDGCSHSFGASVGGDAGGVFGSGSKSHNDSYGIAVGQGTQQSEANGSTKSKTGSVSDTKTDGKTNTETRGKSVQLSIENKKITESLNSISQQLQRLKNGSGRGMYAVGTYFLSDSRLEAVTAANLYKAVISGEETSIEFSGVNSWSGDDFQEVYRYLKNFMHPRFILSPKTGDGVPMISTPATIVTADELAINMGLPQHSINGIPVKESISFGRDVVRLTAVNKTVSEFKLGNIYHLGSSSRKSARLDLDSMTMHTFITGTTGSGKSNTVYGILNTVCESRKDVRFLVIEPAKGEYKSVFGYRDDVTVYGTNPYMFKMLRINPFRFHRNIHILEHIDRLISLFNVCWPMEAAMPAVLKQAVERAYETAGWDLRKSKNSISPNLYPTFTDVMSEINDFIDESDYSSDNKGDYKGALCTRLNELTTGLNGMLFTSNDLEDNALFDENVIVDLSRVESSEIKSLVMGLLIIKMQEYRQSHYHKANSKLNHITVLEEAHNILKRTSTEQFISNANILGKSVEMLSNALAEMRSYGEGFIITDQSPEQLDLSVIRNTNTKIVMRLPSFEDRKLVGKAMSLKDEQIDELSKLPTGVAAVYQNDWMDAVLVQMPYFKESNHSYMAVTDEDFSELNDSDQKSLLYAIMGACPGIDALVDHLGQNAIERICKMTVSTRVKRELISYIRNTSEAKLDSIGRIAFEFFNSNEVMESIREAKSIDGWREIVLSKLQPSIAEFDEWDKNTLILIICHEYATRIPVFKPVYLQLVKSIS